MRFTYLSVIFLLLLFSKTLFANVFICIVPKEGLPPHPEVITEVKEGKLVDMRERHSKDHQAPPQFIEFSEFEFKEDKEKKWPIGEYSGKRKDGYAGTLKIIELEKEDKKEENSEINNIYKATYSRTSKGKSIRNYTASCAQASE